MKHRITNLDNFINESRTISQKEADKYKAIFDVVEPHVSKLADAVSDEIGMKVKLKLDFGGGYSSLQSDNLVDIIKVPFIKTMFTEIDLYASIDYSNNKFKFINIYGETCGITLSFTTQNGKGMSIPIFKEVYFDNKKEDWVIKK